MGARWRLSRAWWLWVSRKLERRRAGARILRLPLLDETRWVQTAEVTAVLLFAALTVIAVRRQPLSFTLFMVGLLYLSVASPITTGPYYLQSAGRFLLAAVPGFLY